MLNCDLCGDLLLEFSQPVTINVKSDDPTIQENLFGFIHPKVTWNYTAVEEKIF